MQRPVSKWALERAEKEATQTGREGRGQKGIQISHHQKFLASAKPRFRPGPATLCDLRQVTLPSEIPFSLLLVPAS